MKVKSVPRSGYETQPRVGASRLPWVNGAVSVSDLDQAQSCRSTSIVSICKRRNPVGVEFISMI